MTNLSNSTINKIKQVGSIYSALTDKPMDVEDVVKLLLNDFVKRFDGLLSEETEKEVKTQKKSNPITTPTGRFSWSKQFNWEQLLNCEPVTLVIGKDIPKGSVNLFKQAVRKRATKFGYSSSIKTHGTRSITIQFKSR